MPTGRAKSFIHDSNGAGMCQERRVIARYKGKRQNSFIVATSLFPATFTQSDTTLPITLTAIYLTRTSTRPHLTPWPADQDQLQTPSVMNAT
jgi:hypothetical protein